jgi:hypothetical protein
MRATQCGLAAFCACAVWATVVAAQPVPQPFPRPSTPRPTASAPPQAPAAPARTAPPAVEEAAPTEALLGLPVYPNCVFLRSYDAGMGQRYYLFGCDTTYGDLVTYYRNVLRTRGEEVYEVPPVYTFEVGRFREETMAFPPGVTVKDYTWAGGSGFLDARLSAQGRRYRTVLQFVPVPAADRKR